MDIQTKRKIVTILNILQKNQKPMGSAAISRQLNAWGLDLQERMVRYYLEITDQNEWTVNLGRRGRTITPRGIQEIHVGIAVDKVGFVAARVDELAYQMNFNPDTQTGSVIVNTSLIKTQHMNQTLSVLSRVIDAGLGMGRMIRISYAGQNHLDLDIPKDHIAVSTICSVSLNGILLRSSISMASRFGGLLEIHEGQPVRFSQIIHYDGTTLDPIVIFIKSRMTSVWKTVQTGTGTIGASFREIPVAALADTERILEKMNRIGMGGVLIVGKPNQPLLDIPVTPGRAGLIVAGGLNPVAALEENGIETNSQALHSVCDFSELRAIDKIIS